MPERYERNMFALTAFKLQMFGGKTRHVLHPIRTCFFLSCPLLDANEGSVDGKFHSFSYLTVCRIRVTHCEKSVFLKVAQECLPCRPK